MSDGLHTSGIPYEYAVAEKKGPRLIFKRITLVALYVLWAAGLFVIGVSTRYIVPFLAFVPLTLWGLVFLTWRYTQVEYEYSFFAGELTAARVLGGRSRKELCRITIRTVSAILPYENDQIKRIEAFSAEKTIFAASSEEAERLYVILWKNESGKTLQLFFEPTEKALKLLRYYNPSAVTLRK